MERSWKYRRTTVFSTLVVCDILLVYLVIFGKDTELHRALANGILILLAAVVNGYMGWASWDDKVKGQEHLHQPRD